MNLLLASFFLIPAHALDIEFKYACSGRDAASNQVVQFTRDDIEVARVHEVKSLTLTIENADGKNVPPETFSLFEKNCGANLEDVILGDGLKIHFRSKCPRPIDLEGYCVRQNL